LEEKRVMPIKRYKPEQIVTMLRQIEVGIANGKTTPQACKEAEITIQTFYRWRKEYGGLKMDQAKRLKDLEKENGGLAQPSANTTRPRVPHPSRLFAKGGWQADRTIGPVLHAARVQDEIRSRPPAVGQPFSFHISVVDDEVTHERRSSRRQVVVGVDEASDFREFERSQPEQPRLVNRVLALTLTVDMPGISGISPLLRISAVAAAVLRPMMVVSILAKKSAISPSPSLSITR
jgi:putative transposase